MHRDSHFGTMHTSRGLGTCAACANGVVVMDPNDRTIWVSEKDFARSSMNLSQYGRSVKVFYNFSAKDRVSFLFVDHYLAA